MNDGPDGPVRNIVGYGRLPNGPECMLIAGWTLMSGGLFPRLVAHWVRDVGADVHPSD